MHSAVLKNINSQYSRIQHLFSKIQAANIRDYTQPITNNESILYSINSSASQAIVSTGVTVAWQEICWSTKFFPESYKN
jgi:hypothetical protein